MQVLARELNLSESVFVRSPADGATAWPTRIFTGSTELPFAGHPTVGTAVLLAELGLVTDSVVLAEGVGEVSVSIERSGATTSATFRTVQAPAYSDAPDRDILARALSIESSELHPKLSAGVWSCGLGFCVVPLRDADVLARTRVDHTVWSEHLEHTDAEHLYPIAPLDESLDRWRARMYATDMGLSDDPATGPAPSAAAGTLAASPQHPKGPPPQVIEQGVETGGPERTCGRRVKK